MFKTSTDLSKMTIPLFISLAFSLALVHGMVIEHDPNECTTEICRQSGEEILKYINYDVSACDDFYEHACGHWHTEHPPSKSEEGSGQFMLLRDKTSREVQELIETDIGERDIEAVHKAKMFYQSCMDLDAMDIKGLRPLTKILKSNGNWPLTNPPIADVNRRHLTLEKIHENLAHITGASALFQIDVFPNRENPTVHSILLSSPYLAIDRYNFFIREKRSVTGNKAYSKYVFAIAEALSKFQGFAVDTQTMKRRVREMIKFEKNVKKAMNPGNEEPTYKFMTIKQIQTTWDEAIKNHPALSINWLDVIRKRFSSTGIRIFNDIVVQVEHDTLVDDLAKLLLKFPIETIVNYVHWKWIDSLLGVTNKQMRDIEAQYLKELWGTQEASSRETKCIKDHLMQNALSYLWVPKHFNRESRDYAYNMSSIMKKQLITEVMESTWLDSETKNIAADKINSIIDFIGYPDWYDNDTMVNEFYKELTVGKDYFENVLAAKRFNVARKLKKLLQPADKATADWQFTPITINAGYYRDANSLNFPAAMLQMPVSHPGKPAILNFAGMGAVFGHEISHSFDNEGRLYSKSGKKREWWPQSAIEEYKKRAKCFVEQYEKYKVLDDPVKNITIYVASEENKRENIADNVGFAAAFKAYKQMKKIGKIPEVKIPALKNFTDEQLYFYGVANIFCEYVRPEYLINVYSELQHSPQSARIVGSLSNMKEFSAAFKCPPGSPMNPNKKCSLWGQPTNKHFHDM